MAKIIRMPEVLAGADEAVISQWLMAEGTEVSVGDTLVEIETEKATVEYQAEDSGTLGRVLLAPGVTASVGDPIAVFLEPGEDPSAIDKALHDAGIGGSEAAQPVDPPPATHAPAAEAAAPEAAALKGAAEPESPPTAAHPPELSEGAPEKPSGSPQGDTNRLFISPIARKMAKDRGIDPATIIGSGPDGRIVRRDVDSAPASPESTPQVAPEETIAGVEEAAYTDRKHTPMRRAIARRLTESKTTVPHFYLTADIRADRLLAVRGEVNEAAGVKTSVNDWIIKAVAQALIDVPDANVIWTDNALRHFHSADISVAVATDGGLYTPVIRGVEKLGLPDISSRVKDMVERARSGTIRQEDIEGGSFAITNLGMFGTQEFSAILNPPQSGILAVGAATDQPIVVDGELAVGKIMTVTLSCDHRAIDGALAAVFLERLQQLLENPVSLLIS